MLTWEPGAEGYGSWRLTLESWRLTWSPGSSTWNCDTKVLKVYSTLELLGSIWSCGHVEPPFETWKLTLEMLRLTLVHRDSLWSH